MGEEDGSVTVRVARVVHDLLNRRSVVELVWPNDDRRLHLPVPFGTGIEQAHAAADAALREHEREIKRTSVAGG